MTSGAWRSDAEPLQDSRAVFSREFLRYLDELSRGGSVSAQDIASLRELIEGSGLSDISGLSGVGLIVKRDGGLTTRAIVNTPRTKITNGTGVGGNVVVDLATLADSGSGDALVKIARDDYGRVSGTESAVLDDLDDVDTTGAVLGDFLKFDGTYWVPGAAAGASGSGAIGATFDGGGAALVPGVFVDVLVPFNCTIVAATLLADQTGSLVVSVLADPYASFPPTTDIAPTTPPTISAADKSQDVTLSGWTTAITAGTVVRLSIASSTSIERATLTLEVTKP